MNNAVSHTVLIEKSLARRRRAERRFRWYGRLALVLAASALALLLAGIVIPGVQGFRQTQISFTLTVPEKIADSVELRHYAGGMVRQALLARFPHVSGDAVARRQLFGLIASAPSLGVVDAWERAGRPYGQSFVVWLPASDRVDMLMKGRIDLQSEQAARLILPRQVSWIETLRADGRIRLAFNSDFLQRGDSRDPARAGFLGGIVGSLLTLLVCLLASFPVGVMAAIYLEEFAPKNRFTSFIEVNINNLAAVPSIVYGLLGLAVFLNLFGMPRSAPLAGGLTLALMTLPVIIIATRASLRAVPDSIRMAALGLGATRFQATMHHVLPLAMPGVMTGAILGMARAIGETAPLLMIGMVAFIVDIPQGLTDAATVMPVQIFLWAGSAEMGFADKTAAGIMLLILMLLAMNALAIYGRRRFERRW